MQVNTQQSSSGLIDFVNYYVSLGFSLLPIRLDGTKAPTVGGWQLSNVQFDPAWLAHGSCGLGIRCGTPSRNLVVIDFDEDGLTTFHRWWQLMSTECPQVLSNIVIVETPRPGVHVYLLCDGTPPATQKLASRQTTDTFTDHAGNTHYKSVTLIETRSTGAYVVAWGSPSVVHTSQRPYQKVYGEFHQLTPVHAATVTQVLAICERFNEVQAAVPLSQPSQNTHQERTGTHWGPPRPGDVFNRRVDVRDVMKSFGWSYQHATGSGVEYWARPGKSFGTSGTVSFAKTNQGYPKLYVYSSNASPLLKDASYDAFSLWAMYAHGGSLEAAAKELVAKHASEIEAEQDVWLRTAAEQVIVPQPVGKVTRKLVDQIANLSAKPEAKRNIIGLAVKYGIAPSLLYEHTSTLFTSEQEIVQAWPDAVRDYQRSVVEAHVNKTSKKSITEIDVSPAVPVNQICDEITQVVTSQKSAYKFGDLLITPTNEIVSKDNLVGKIAANIEFVIKEGHVALPAHILSRWYDSQQRTNLPEVQLYTNCPQYDKNWALVQPGYNPQSMIYYSGNSVKPRQGLTTLCSLVNPFPFENRASFQNFVGLLVSCLLVEHLKGDRPLGMFTGNGPGVGKSSLASIACMIYAGDTKRFQSSDFKDGEELSKIINSMLFRGAVSVMVDNVKGTIDSSYIESLITRDYIDFRQLGQTNMVTVPNTVLWTLTANDPRATEDLKTRSLPVPLIVSGDTKQYWSGFAQKKTPSEATLEVRDEILGELVSLVSNWVALGRPGPLTPNPSRFSRFWDTVGGIMHANGFMDFMTNLDSAITAESDLDFDKLCEGMARGKQAVCWGVNEKHSDDGFWRASELCVLAKSLGIYAEAAVHAKTMGKMLGKITNKQMDLEGFGKVQLVRHTPGDTSKPVVYSLGAV